MKSHRIINSLFLAIIGLFLTTACSEDLDRYDHQNLYQKKIQISGNIDQIYTSRVNDGGFCNKDKVGIYITDYNGDQPSELKNEGNRADNIQHEYQESENKWIPTQDIYWKDSKTHIDVYGYYPYSEPSDVKSYAFEVAQDQHSTDESGQMGGYESSDFLWGKATNIAPTDQVINLAFRHKMANVRVLLEEGTGFNQGEWAQLDKEVIVLNTVRKSTIDLSNGNVKAIGGAPEIGILPYKDFDKFCAIVVPQEIQANVDLFSITVGGISYKFQKDVNFVYEPGKQHNFTIRINKKENTGEYEFIVGAESITAWENDNMSHDAVARAYVIINVPDYGQLEQSIALAKKDYSKLKNLKLTGKINADDFYFMRDKMTLLQALNIREVEVYGDHIPESAMKNKQSLMRLILPDKLKGIDPYAFEDCSNLVGSLIIPEGVTQIGIAAFKGCKSMTGTLSLPSTLEKIDGEYLMGAFIRCGFSGKLILPEQLKSIGESAFEECLNLTGELRLPDNLEALGNRAFINCVGLTGSIHIPHKIKHIGNSAFAFTGVKGYQGNFNGTLKLPKGLISIASSAFMGTGLRGELNLPDGLIIIPDQAFKGCDFSGELKIPSTVSVIGSESFANNWRLTGDLIIPKDVQSIGSSAFMNCKGISSIIFEDGIETIGRDAFNMCVGVGRIICKAGTPPDVMPNAFDGIPKDNFTLEVPDAAIHLYQTAPGWREFKRIAAYRNFVVRPAMATAINTSVSRKLTLNADAPWTLESKPDWISVDKKNGNQKTEITITFAEMPMGSSNREGEIVFKLNNKDYRTRCKVSQYNYEYQEDKVITLQKATKGNGINIMILGDGYSAKDISEGKYMTDVKRAYEHYFNIEPYNTYRNYFNVYTAIAVSPESGIGGINTIVHNRFNTSAKGGVTLSGRNGESDFKAIMEYSCKAPSINNAKLGETLIIMIPNTTDYGGICYMYDDGCAIAYCPKSDLGYPYDFRGVVQHEAGGHGFGKLADEYIYHNAFIDNCSCSCCEHANAIRIAHAKGWYANISLTGKPNEVPWSHLIMHSKYHSLVDVFEGGFMHTRGVYRSEQNSCMNNEIPYYSTISREAIVKRIKKIAGETYSFEDFVANDKTEAVIATKSTRNSSSSIYYNSNYHNHAPIFLKNRPQVNDRK